MIMIRLTVLAGIALACSGSTLTLLPGTAISGAPGSTIGWGYSIQNTSATQWLQPLSLSTGSFASLNPVSIFDFPAIAPGQTVTELFSTTTLNGACSQLPCGLYEIVIPSGTSPVTVSGTFTILSDFFNGNPNGSGVDAGSAPNLTAAYSVSVTPASAIPEPASVMLVITALAAGISFARRKIPQV